LPLTDAAAKFGQANAVGLPEAAKLLASHIFAEGKRGAGPKETSQISDFWTKASQITGMGAEELDAFVKGHAAEAAGVSMPFLLAQGATLRQAGIAEPGQAALRFAAMLSKPTPDALAALDASGVHFKDYAKVGPMQAGNLSSEFERLGGRKFSATGLKNVQAVLSDKTIAGDEQKLTAALTKILEEAPKKPGGKSPDAAAIAKVIKKFWESSLESVDVEGLEKALIAKGVSGAQAEAIFGKRSGLMFPILSGHAKELAGFERQMKNVPEGLAAREAEKQMGGFAGAKIRAGGEWENVLTTLFKDNEGALTGLYNAETNLEKAFVDASPDVRHLAEAAGIAATALMVLGGAHAGMKTIDKLAGGGTAFGLGAAGLGWAGSALIPGAPAIMAGMGAGLVAGSTPLNAGGDEVPRQRTYGQGPMIDFSGI
jgi:hypothetical protein